MAFLSSKAYFKMHFEVQKIGNHFLCQSLLLGTSVTYNTMTTSYFKSATRCILTHIHLWAGWYAIHIHLKLVGLLLHITTSPSSRIVTEESNFILMQLQVQYALCFMKAEIWIHKSRVAIFINYLASTMNQSCNTIIEEPKLSFCATRSSMLLCKIWIHRSWAHTWRRLSMIISLKQLWKRYHIFKIVSYCN